MRSLDSKKLVYLTRLVFSELKQNKITLFEKLFENISQILNK